MSRRNSDEYDEKLVIPDLLKLLIPNLATLKTPTYTDLYCQRMLTEEIFLAVVRAGLIQDAWFKNQVIEIRALLKKITTNGAFTHKALHDLKEREKLDAQKHQENTAQDSTVACSLNYSHEPDETQPLIHPLNLNTETPIDPRGPSVLKNQQQVSRFIQMIGLLRALSLRFDHLITLLVAIEYSSRQFPQYLTVVTDILVLMSGILPTITVSIMTLDIATYVKGDYMIYPEEKEISPCLRAQDQLQRHGPRLARLAMWNMRYACFSYPEITPRITVMLFFFVFLENAYMFHFLLSIFGQLLSRTKESLEFPTPNIKIQLQNALINLQEEKTKPALTQFAIRIFYVMGALAVVADFLPLAIAGTVMIFLTCVVENYFAFWKQKTIGLEARQPALSIISTADQSKQEIVLPTHTLNEDGLPSPISPRSDASSPMDSSLGMFRSIAASGQGTPPATASFVIPVGEASAKGTILNERSPSVNWF